LKFLNETTQAWVEMEYNRSLHEELGASPLTRLLQGPDVSRPGPDSDLLRRAFTVRETRKQRRSDGTVQIGGVRFEVPSLFRHFDRLYIRYCSWDLSFAYLVDQRTDNQLAIILPLDKKKNGLEQRRALAQADPSPTVSDPAEPIPPLLRKIMNNYAATGLPAGYLPKDEER